MALSEHHDLRSGPTPWDEDRAADPPADAMPARVVDVAIVGAGVMGAMLAARLAGRGLGVAMVDRRPPASGSTAASTALVLWEADVPLTHLAARIGEEAAVARWRRVHRAVRDLAGRIDASDLDAERIDRPSLYLEGDLLDPVGLVAEAALRARHGLPSAFLEAGAVAERFGVRPRPGLVSADSYETNPVRLTQALLGLARKAGATVSHPVDVTGLAADPEGVVLTTDRGPLRARQAILACGYERPRAYLPGAFSLISSYAVATAPGTAPLWRENAMIWEASESYLYARADADGRIIAGGGDEDFSDAPTRDALIGPKAAEIAGRLGATTGAEIAPTDRWAAMFGSSPDGLPAIGRASPDLPLWLAGGFGGNGITFAALAADLLSPAVTGEAGPDLALFDPRRFAAR